MSEQPNTIDLTPTPDGMRQMVNLVLADFTKHHGLTFKQDGEGVIVDGPFGGQIQRCDDGNDLMTFLAGYGSASRRYKVDEERIDLVCEEIEDFAAAWDGLKDDTRARVIALLRGEGL